MKNRYKIILILLILEYFCLSLMNKFNIKIQSWLGNAVGALLFLSPLLILLYILKKDDDVSVKFRILAKFLFWFLVFCFMAGGIGKAIALNS